MKKPIWRSSFNVAGRVGLGPYTEMIECIYDLQTVTVKKRFLSQGIYVLENLNNTGSYFLKDKLRGLAEEILHEIIINQDKIDSIHKKTTLLNTEYFNFAKPIRKLNLSKLSNQKLLSLHKKLFHLQSLSHGWALCTTWFVDSDGEDFTNYLQSVLKEKIASTNSGLELVQAFRTITTPNQKTLGQIEEEESLKIVEWINKSKELKNWFVNHITSELAADFKNLSAAAKRKLWNHYYKWCWTPFGYLGPVYELDYYLEVWRGLLHQNIDVPKKLKEINENKKRTQKERAEIIKKLKLSTKEKHLFDIATDIVWLKSYRKDCYYHGFFVMNLLLTEVARRTGLSPIQAQYLTPEELPLALRGKNLADTANGRMEFCVLYNVGRKIKILTGETAKKFLKKYNFEKIKIENTDEINGTCACPGMAKGKVKIVNLPEDIKKMEDGDIMISHTTYPALVPAMKKAAAIVTEDGGITCHAAIVSREMQTPCVVGCKNALNVLKDGDVVEVDANNGIIRIIK